MFQAHLLTALSLTIMFKATNKCITVGLCNASHENSRATDVHIGVLSDVDTKTHLSEFRSILIKEVNTLPDRFCFTTRNG